MLEFVAEKRRPMCDVEKEIHELILSEEIEPSLPLYQILDVITRKHSVSKLCTHKLTFNANDTIGFSCEGAVVEDKDSKMLVKLSLGAASASSTMYTTTWQKPRPSDIRENSSKYVLSNGNIVMRYGSTSPTIVCDSDLNLIVPYSGQYGQLRGVVHGDKLLYSRKIGGRYQLDVYRCDDHSHICTLPVSVQPWGISTSSHQSGMFVVVNFQARTLDILTLSLTHQSRVELPYTPRPCNAVCWVGDCIVVAESGGLYIYTMSGEQLTHLTLGDLGVTHLHGIHEGGEGQIQVATGWMDSFHVYEVK